MADTHKTYPTEFKLEAIKRSGQLGHTASSAARDLGISPYLIHRWIRQQAKHEGAGKPSFTGRGVPALTQQEFEIARLKRELETAKQERDILKKALACLGLNSTPWG